MKYKIIIFSNTLFFSISKNKKATDYIRRGINIDEYNKINKNVDDFEEALNMVCSQLNLKLVSMFPGVDRGGYDAIICVFETINSVNLLEEI